MWAPVALLSARATTTEAKGGRITGPLEAAGLVVRLRSLQDMRPLAYCYIQLRADDGTRTAAQERYTPTADPQLVRIDPGPLGQSFSGSLVLIPRSYNRRWLEVGLPSPVLSVWAEAWLPEGAADPDAVVPGFRDGVGRLLAGGAAVGPAQAVELTRA